MLSTNQIETTLRRAYDACAATDIAAIDALLAPEVVFHVPGHHILSGTYTGKDAVFGHMARVAEISGGRGGFDVRDITTGDGHGVALVVGTAYLGDEPLFVLWCTSGT